jgi:nucleotide-binding universal stress UspA family protein
VAGVDGSEAARAALAWALGEARIRRATLEAVHAWHYPFAAAAVGTVAVPFDGDPESWATRLLDDELALVGRETGDVAILRRVENGPAAQALLKASLGAAMVVVGSRGRRQMTGALLGSVSQFLVARAACPVVVIHRHGETSEDRDDPVASHQVEATPGSLEDMSEAECLALLAGHGVGRLAVTADGQPLVFPVNYILDGHTVVIRTDPGTKLGWATLGQVAFEIDSIDPVHNEGWSVLVKGHGHDITDGVDASSIAVRSAPLAPWAAGPKGHWIAITSPEFSGRRLHHQPTGEESDKTPRPS